MSNFESIYHPNNKIELWDEDYNFVRSLSSDTDSEDDAKWIADDTTAQGNDSIEKTIVRVFARKTTLVLAQDSVH